MVCQKGGRQNWIPGRHVMQPILAQVDQAQEQTQTQPAAQSMRMPEGNWNMPSTTHTLPTSLVPVSAYIHTRSWRWRQRLRRIVRRRRRRAEGRERDKLRRLKALFGIRTRAQKKAGPRHELILAPLSPGIPHINWNGIPAEIRENDKIVGICMMRVGSTRARQEGCGSGPAPAWRLGLPLP